MGGIPRVIHQTWKDERIPDGMASWVASWHRLHPDWEYRLWTDEDNRALVRAQFPELLPRYDAYSNPVERADAARYLYLFVHGGIYADLDYECLRPMGPLLRGRTCVLGLEPDEHCRTHHRPRIVSDAWIAAAPGHPLLAAVLEELLTCQPLDADANLRILEGSGPFMLTRVADRLTDEDVTVLPSEVVFPLSSGDVDRIARDGLDASDRDRLSRAYGVHYFAGTWWK